MAQNTASYDVGQVALIAKGGTRGMPESMRAQYVCTLKIREQREDQRGSGLLSLIGDPWEVAKKGIVYLLRYEAEKYEAKYSAQSELFGFDGLMVDRSGWSLLDAAQLFIFSRTVTPEKVRNDMVIGGPADGMPVLDGSHYTELCRKIGDAAMANGLEFTERGEAQLLNAISQIAPPKKQVLQFCAAVVMFPRGTSTEFGGHPSDGSKHFFSFGLLGVAYPLLKAKGDREDTRSVLSVSVQGPLSDPSYGGGRFEASDILDVSWSADQKVEMPLAWRTVRTVRFGAKVFAVPNLIGCMEFRAGMLETNDWNSTLRRIASLVDQINI